MTVGMVSTLTLYALCTKHDYSVSRGTIMVFTSVLSIYGLTMLYTSVNYGYLIFTAIGIIVFGVYLVIDTNMLFHGKKQNIEKEDHVLGAIILYLDILNIFLYSLKLLTCCKK